MPQAWQVRDFQRQSLLERLMHLVHEKDETVRGKCFLFDTARAIMAQLAFIKEQQEVPTVLNEAGSFFLETVLPEIMEFARVPEEVGALLVKLLETVQKSACNPFAAALLHKEMDDPKTVYGTPSRMTDVTLEGIP